MVGDLDSSDNPVVNDVNMGVGSDSPDLVIGQMTPFRPINARESGEHNQDLFGMIGQRNIMHENGLVGVGIAHHNPVNIGAGVPIIQGESGLEVGHPLRLPPNGTRPPNAGGTSGSSVQFNAIPQIPETDQQLPTPEDNIPINYALPRINSNRGNRHIPVFGIMPTTAGPSSSALLGPPDLHDLKRLQRNMAAKKSKEKKKAEGIQLAQNYERLRQINRNLVQRVTAAERRAGITEWQVRYLLQAIERIENDQNQRTVDVSVALLDENSASSQDSGDG